MLVFFFFHKENDKYIVLWYTMYFSKTVKVNKPRLCCCLIIEYFHPYRQLLKLIYRFISSFIQYEYIQCTFLFLYKLPCCSDMHFKLRPFLVQAYYRAKSKLDKALTISCLNLSTMQVSFHNFPGFVSLYSSSIYFCNCETTLLPKSKTCFFITFILVSLYVQSCFILLVLKLHPLLGKRN